MNFETIYQDIITNVLPKVQEGLTITKDYVFEFMERYITYLIIIDIISIVTAIIVFIISMVAWIKIWKRIGDDKGLGNENMAKGLFSICFGFVIIICLCVISETTIDLIKILTIPEVRIFEEYQEMKGNFK